MLPPMARACAHAARPNACVKTVQTGGSGAAEKNAQPPKNRNSGLLWARRIAASVGRRRPIKKPRNLLRKDSTAVFLKAVFVAKLKTQKILRMLVWRQIQQCAGIDVHMFQVHASCKSVNKQEGTRPLTGLWYGVVDKNEDSLLRVELDPLADDVNELAWTRIMAQNRSRAQADERRTPPRT